MKHDLGVLSQVITWLVGPVTVVVALATYARQWPVSYRRATGWTLAALGAVLALSSAGWLAAAHLSASTGRGSVLIAAVAVGLILTGAGLVRAVRAPVDPGIEALRAIAAAVETHVIRLEEADSFDDGRFIPLRISRGPARTGRQLPLNRSLSRVKAQLIGLVGDSGTGKTVSLRHMARHACHDVKRRRNPSLIALYVDLAAFNDSPETVTADRIYSYIQDVIAVGNTTLSSHFTRYVREPRDRPEWFILFDSFDALLQPVELDRRDVAARQYLEAIRQFLSSTGPSFRGVVACRESRLVESLGGAVLTLAPLSQQQIGTFSQQAGLNPALKRQLLQRVRWDPALAPVARSPLLLSFLCDHLRETRGSEFPSTPYEIVRTAVAARLDSAQISSAVEDTVRVAERIAYYMTADAEPNHVPSYDDLIAVLQGDSETMLHPETGIQDLIRVGIARAARPQTFAFSFRSFQEHFAVRRLLRSWRNHDLRCVAMEPRWRSAAIAALQVGPEDLRDALVIAFAEVLAGEAEMDPSVVKTVASLTAIDVGEPLPLTPSASFTWPRTALRVLQILAIGLRREPGVLPSELRNNADRLIVSAFAAGLLLDQQQAIEISATATTEVALWAAERALASPSERLQHAAAQQVAAAPPVFALLRPQQRITATYTATRDPAIIHQAFNKLDGKTSPTWSLTGSLRDLVITGQVTAWILAIYSLKGLIGDLSSIPEWHRHGVPSGIVFWPILIIVAGLFLGIWAARRRGSEVQGDLAFYVSVSLVVIAVLTAVLGIIYFIAAIVFLVVGPFLSAVTAGIAAYAMTWPVAMAARIMVGPLRTPWDWALPQVPAIHMAFTFLARQYTDYFRQNRSAASKRVQSADIGEAILRWLDEASTPKATQQVLRRLADAAPGVNAPATNVLRDLARALEWVHRMVPAGTSTAIPPGIWDVGPKFSSPQFRDWLRQFDKRHPGRLSWLAAKHREEIAQALERADLPNV